MKEQITIRMPTELKQQLEKEADIHGYSLNAYIMMLIRKGHQG